MEYLESLYQNFFQSFRALENSSDPLGYWVNWFKNPHIPLWPEIFQGLSWPTFCLYLTYLLSEEHTMFRIVRKVPGCIIKDIHKYIYLYIDTNLYISREI